MLGAFENLDFGYAFEPDGSPDRPAHRRLTVVLRPAPTHAHYDPEHVSLPIFAPHGDLERLTVYHPWNGGPEYRAGPGRVILVDRVGKKVEAFTFGGQASVNESAAQVVLRIESPVPILALQFPDTVSFRLAAVVEGLLAQRRAAWDVRGHPAGLDERLAGVAPLVLYQACLQAIHQWLAADFTLNAASDHRLEHFVKAEINGLVAAGRWSVLARPLDELL
jgi:hypothetical protein